MDRVVDSRRVLTDLLLAVSVEQAARKRTAPEWRDLDNVVTRRVTGRRVLLTATDLDQPLVEGARTLLRVDGEQYRAEVVGLGLGELTLLLDDCEVTDPQTCSLKVPVDDYLQGLADFLSASLTEHGTTLAPSSTVLADDLATGVAAHPAHSPRVTYVMGAPGSGKTTRLVASATARASRGQKVMVVTYTNAAADVIFSRLVETTASSGLTITRLGFTPAAMGVETRAESDTVTATRSLDEAMDADIVVTTAYRALMCAGRGVGTHSSVLIDEASTVPLALAWTSALLARDEVEVYGDPYQLGVITTREDPDPNPERTVRQRFETSPFEVDGVMAAARIPGSPLVLREQHRLPRALARAATPPIYYAPTPEQADYEPESPWGFGSLLYIDTSRTDAVCEKAHGSRKNIHHADIVVEALRALLEQGTITPESASQSLLIVTPYRAQRFLISQKLSATGWLPDSSIQALVTTIHRAQGSERPFVLVDTTEAPLHDQPHNSAPGRLWDGKGWQSQGSRLLTTALTRATHQALVVMYRSITGTPQDPYSENVRALPRLNAMLNKWGTALEWRQGPTSAGS